MVSPPSDARYGSGSGVRSSLKWSRQQMVHIGSLSESAFATTAVPIGDATGSVCGSSYASAMPFQTVASYAGFVVVLEAPSSQMQLAAAMSSLRVSSTSSPSAAPVKLITENLVMLETSSM